MCTVVCRWLPGKPIHILALRDEFVGRDFDGPGTWWPAQPTVVGGRDRQAGGSWCVSDVTTGVTALVLNRIERRDGTPSRGLLPLAAVAEGEGWPEQIDHTRMASFNLVLAGPSGVAFWSWDASTLQRRALEQGSHVVTSRGVDTEDPKTVRFGPQFEQHDWYQIVTSSEPSDDPSALVVRHEIDIGVYATVFGQLITTEPGRLAISSSRTPWRDGTWTGQAWPPRR